MFNILLYSNNYFNAIYNCIDWKYADVIRNLSAIVKVSGWLLCVA